MLTTLQIKSLRVVEIAIQMSLIGMSMYFSEGFRRFAEFCWNLNVVARKSFAIYRRHSFIMYLFLLVLSHASICIRGLKKGRRTHNFCYLLRWYGNEEGSM